MHTLTSVLHMLQRMSEKRLLTGYSATKHLKHNKLMVLHLQEKPVISLVSTNRRVAFSVAKTLLIKLLCKQFRSCEIFNSLVKGLCLWEL